MEIWKFCEMGKNWLSMTILNNNLLHGTVHHPTKFQADSLKSKSGTSNVILQTWPKPIIENLKVPWNTKIGRAWPF